LITLPRVVCIYFVISFILAMIIYAGGTINDPESMGYSFTRNFFSDLGKFTTENIISAMMFNLSLIVCGWSFAAYFFYFTKLFNQNTIIHILAKVGSFSGIIGALCFIGVGLTPHNLFLDYHIVFVNWAFRSFLLAGISLSVVLYKDNRFENRFAMGYFIFAILTFLYVLVLEFAPDPKISDFALIFNVIAQKIIIFAFIFSILYQSFGNSKLLAKYWNE
ncbi:MAG: hypothetical protein ABGX14_04865, partial [bacterium]